MSVPRFLTFEEAALLQQAAEQWLRLRDIEHNPGAYAMEILADCVLRDDACARRDIASLGRSILLEVPRKLEPLRITLARPGEEDRSRGEVSLLSDMGLACIGRVICSSFGTPHGIATFIGFADTSPFLHLDKVEDAERRPA